MITPDILINQPDIQLLYPWYTPNSRLGGPKKRSGPFGENIFPILGFGASIVLHYPVFRIPELGWHSLLWRRAMKHIFSQQYCLEVRSHLAWNAVWMPATNSLMHGDAYSHISLSNRLAHWTSSFPPAASPSCTHLSQWTQALSPPFYSCSSVHTSHSQQLAAWTVSKHTVTAHIATPIFLFTAQVYFLDLASQLNHSTISLSSKSYGKMRIATYGYSKRKYRFSITGVRVSTGYAWQKRARPPVANDLLLDLSTCMCRNTQFCNNSSDVFLR